jgi:hypothetical protein
MPAKAVVLRETQRIRRGHPFLPDAEEMAAVPRLYETDGVPAENKEIVAHYFSASCDWWLAEIGDTDGDPIGFGYCQLFPDGGEWGYVDLRELEEVNAFHGVVIVERDCFWTPAKFNEVRT